MKPPFRHNLLSASIGFICRYWDRPYLTKDYRIGEALRKAQSIAAGVWK